MSEPEITPDHILQTGTAFWASKALLSAVELELFTDLAKSPADLDTLRTKLGLHQRGARDFLDALMALGFLNRNDGIYSNTAECDLFLDKNKTSYIGGILEMANHRLFVSWANLTAALKTGLPQSEEKTGEDFFADLYADAAKLKEFLGAMTGVSRAANMAMARQLPWSDYNSYADIGTAQGDLAVQIALAQPHLRGIGFDLPQVSPVFEDYVKANETSDRLSFVAGDFFQNELPTADVILMGHILHDWDLEQKQILIRKAWQALPVGGLFVVYDSLIDDNRRENAFGLLMSLNMLIETPGGFDYTGADCIGWMEDAGFKNMHIEHLVGPDSMVVGVK